MRTATSMLVLVFAVFVGVGSNSLENESRRKDREYSDRRMTVWGPKLSAKEIEGINRLPQAELVEMLKHGV